jgi:hypothetical protein
VQKNLDLEKMQFIFVAYNIFLIACVMNKSVYIFRFYPAFFLPEGGKTVCCDAPSEAPRFVCVGMGNPIISGHLIPLSENPSRNGRRGFFPLGLLRTGGAVCRDAYRLELPTAVAAIHTSSSAAAIVGAAMTENHSRPAIVGAAMTKNHSPLDILRIACHNVAKAPQIQNRHLLVAILPSQIQSRYLLIAILPSQIQNCLLLIAEMSLQIERPFLTIGKVTFKPETAFLPFGQTIFKLEGPFPQCGKPFQNAKRLFCYPTFALRKLQPPCHIVASPPRRRHLYNETYASPPLQGAPPPSLRGTKQSGARIRPRRDGERSISIKSSIVTL